MCKIFFQFRLQNRFDPFLSKVRQTKDWHWRGDGLTGDTYQIYWNYTTAQLNCFQACILHFENSLEFSWIQRQKRYVRSSNLAQGTWPLSILLFESIRVLWVLLYPASRPNHTSYRKFYFYEFVANFLRDNMGMTIFDLLGCQGC